LRRFCIFIDETGRAGLPGPLIVNGTNGRPGGPSLPQTQFDGNALPLAAAPRPRCETSGLGLWWIGLALGCALFFLPLPLLGLDPAKSVFQYNCQNWTRQNGLPVEKISSISQTKDGYLWLGTQNGLVRFDGLDFKAVPIKLPQAQGQEVRSLVQARDGGLWFSIDNGGFGHFDGRKFSPLGDERWTKAVMNAASIMEARDGTVWTGAFAGLGHWMNGKPGDSSFDETTGRTVLAFAQDASGRLWLGTTEAGLFHLEDGKLVQFSDDYLKKRNLFALACDADGSLWVGTELGLRCYDSHGRIREIPPNFSECRALLVDRHGILWAGTTGNGLARIANGTFTYLHKVDGLASDNVTALFEDAEGSLWIGTQDGLSQLTELKFPIYSSKEGLPGGSTHAVTPSRKGGLWISFNGGIAYFNGSVAQNYTDGIPYRNHYIQQALEAANGDVYLTEGDKSIAVLSGGALAKEIPCPEWPQAYAEDAGGILVGVGSELRQIRGGQLQAYPFGNGLQPAFYWINNLLVARDGAIWVASNNGVFRVQGGSWEQWSTANGLPSDRIQSIIEDEDGSIWVGTMAGLVRLKEHRSAAIRLEQGLYDDRIYALVPDTRGSFWFSSGRGIFRATRQSLNDCADGRTAKVQCESFDGLDSVKFSDRSDQSPSGCRTLDGRVWFPNPHGVVMIDPNNYFINRVPPPVHLSQVRLDGAVVDDRTTTIRPTGNGRIEFYFTALSYISPKKVRVQYRLEEFDPAWVDAGDHRSVLYNNLKPGHYRFRIQACNADGIWNTTGDSVDIELPPPFYETAWFQAFLLLVAALALFGAYRWKVRHLAMRQRRLQAENDRLEAKVAERTAELAHEQALLRGLMDSSPDHIYFKDRDSRFLKASKALAENLGAPSPEHMIGKTDFDYFSKEHATPAFEDEQQVIRTGQPIINKIEQEVREDGHVTWALTNKMALRNAAGEIVGTFGISRDITAIKQAEAQLERVHRQLLVSSREAGMAEVATSVLHNVGNVLNSVNVSAGLVSERLRTSKIDGVARLAQLFKEQGDGLARFLADDARGRVVPAYLEQLAVYLEQERQEVRKELGALVLNIEHIKEIVGMQQNYARVSGLVETVSLADLAEDAIKMHGGAYARHGIVLQRDYEELPPMSVNKHKVLQILVNLLHNSKYACEATNQPEKRVTLRLKSSGAGRVKIEVADNGVGIPAENLTRIFSQGFTTRKGGHGFGLHSSVLAAQEMGGILTACSDGPGHGATFTLELPRQPPSAGQKQP
jgi:PAS domain S-box-containing protein